MLLCCRVKRAAFVFNHKILWNYLQGPLSPIKGSLAETGGIGQKAVKGLGGSTMKSFPVAPLVLLVFILRYGKAGRQAAAPLSPSLSRGQKFSVLTVSVSFPQTHYQKRQESLCTAEGKMGAKIHFFTESPAT
ncbi:hypothetical protein HPG69_006361, partial [Diceros bicornis minor]